MASAFPSFDITVEDRLPWESMHERVERPNARQVPKELALFAFDLDVALHLEWVGDDQDTGLNFRPVPSHSGRRVIDGGGPYDPPVDSSAIVSLD